MSSSPKDVRFRGEKMYVDLADGRCLEVRLSSFPRLQRASESERQGFRLSPAGIHWQAIDEDISVAGLLAGVGDLTKPRRAAAE